MNNEESNRLRTHPEQRFAAPLHQFDLDAVVAKLKSEAESGEAGHRQETLYKHGSTSVSLFLFGRLTRLSSHRAKGVVTIQVLQGHLQVGAEGKIHDLRAHGLLTLAPGVEHDVVAMQETEMLLTVSIQS